MEEWKEYKLGELLSIRYGKDHKKLYDGIIPVYGSGGIMRYVNQSIYDSPSILIPRKGSLNNIIYTDTPFWTVDTMFWTIVNTKLADPKYLYYAICKFDFAGLNVGSAVPSLTVSVIGNIDIVLPSLNKQKNIVSILSTFDNKIELNRRINENLEQQAQALFKSWFVDFEPFKDGKFVDSELGMIPEGWKVGTLSDIANVIMGQSPKGTSYNERGDGIVFYQGRADFGNRYPSVRLFTTEPTRYAEPFSVLLSVRAPVGDINIAVEKCCIGRGLASIYSKTGHQSFVLYTMFSLKKELDKFNSEGTVFGSINRSSIESLKIVIPPIGFMDKFEHLVSKIDNMLLKLFQETTHLAQLRDTLLPKLMSGELKLSEIETKLDE